MNYIVYHPRGFRNEVAVSAHDRYSDHQTELDQLSSDRTVIIIKDATTRAKYIRKIHMEWAQGRDETEMIFLEAERVA